MGAAYYRGFSVGEIDTDGFVQPVVSIDLDVENITAASSLGTVSVDASGIVAEGSFSASDGDVVEFSHPSYPLKFRQTLTNTQDEAYLHPDNNVVTFILENNYASTNEVTEAYLYAQDLDDMGQRPQLLGTVKAGTTTPIPFQTSVTKNLRLMLVSKDGYGSQNTADFAYAPSEDLSVPALAPGTVTSVGLTVPSFLSVSGSPITSSGTLAVSLANQPANTVHAGPTSGGAAAPTFRALVAADIPNLDASKITAGTIATARLGSGTANSTTFLRGDQTWQTISTGITVGTTPISSGTNGRVLFQSGGVVQQSGSFLFNGTDLDMSAGGNIILQAGYLYQRQNGRTRYFNNASSNYADMWNPSSDGSAKLNIFDGTGTGIHLDGGGNVGIGTTSPSTKLHVMATSSLFRAGYDASNYLSVAVSSTGVVTLDAVGSGAKFTFSDNVEVPDEAYSSSWDTKLSVPTKNALFDHFVERGWQKCIQALGSPTGTDDTTQGYEPGSIWVDISGPNAYICVDATATAANWLRFV